MSKEDPQLIVALDVETCEEAKSLVTDLIKVIDIYKVGSQLFTLCGPEIVHYIQSLGKKVFLDLKYHDIPNTVGHALQSAVQLSTGGIYLVTVHIMGGQAMMESAVEHSRQQAEKNGVTSPLIIGITVLTSDENQDNIQQVVGDRVKLAKTSGLHGVVASALEVPFIRKEFGEDLLIVTPGIRPSEAQKDDQKRVTTPKEAIANGSNFLVVGRPIVKASNPLEAAKAILKEMKS